MKLRKLRRKHVDDEKTINGGSAKSIISELVSEVNGVVGEEEEAIVGEVEEMKGTEIMVVEGLIEMDLDT